MVPLAVAHATIAHERAAIAAWASAHGWTAELDADALQLKASAPHPVALDADEQIVTITFVADLAGYPALPPAWTCQRSDGMTTKAAYPAAGTIPGISGSIFHPEGVICAPWNRLAYGDRGGPHSNWTDPANWKTVEPSATRADTLVDMLAVLDVHLAASPGMLS